MKIAFARAGLWFSGVFVFLLFVIMFSDDKDVKAYTFWEALSTCLFFGLVAGVTAFFWTWHSVLMEEEKNKKSLNQKLPGKGGGEPE